MQDEILSNMNQSRFSVCAVIVSTMVKPLYTVSCVHCKLARHALDRLRTLNLGMYASRKYRISAKLNYG